MRVLNSVKQLVGRDRQRTDYACRECGAGFAVLYYSCPECGSFNVDRVAWIEGGSVGVEQADRSDAR